MSIEPINPPAPRQKTEVKAPGSAVAKPKKTPVNKPATKKTSTKKSAPAPKAGQGDAGTVSEGELPFQDDGKETATPTEGGDDTAPAA